MAAVVIAALALSVVATGLLPQAVDWQGAFSPATQALLQGDNPYQGYGVHNPPWALVALVPFATATHAGRGALFVVGLVVYALVALRAEAKPLALGLWMTCPPLLHTLLHGNLEWLVFVGLLVPPRWGLFFVLVKPQVAGMLAVWWTVEAWRSGGWRAVVQLLWPVTLALLLSALWFGAWWRSSLGMRSQWWNASLWPWSIVPGLVLLALALWKREWRYALAASPMLSPYVLLHAWAGAVLATVHKPWLVAAVVALLWWLVLRQAI